MKKKTQQQHKKENLVNILEDITFIKKNKKNTEEENEKMRDFLSLSFVLQQAYKYI